MAEVARELGLTPLILGDALEGESREMGIVLAGIARSVRTHAQPLAPPAVLLSGGETTVTLGGGAPGAAAATPSSCWRSPWRWTARRASGRSPATPTASTAWMTSPVLSSTPDTLARARAKGSTRVRCWPAMTATACSTRIGDAIRTGPTLTNVNDVRAI